MSIKANFPEIKPSLMLDFANTKRLDPRITFTRATTATYYDGKTVAKAEENLLTNSQTLNERNPFRSTWTANDTTAPDGTATAEALNQNAGQTTSGGVSLSSVDFSGVTTTFSCFAKANTKNFIAFYISTSAVAANYVYFDLDTGAVGTVGANITAASIVNAGNGWYRCIATMTGGNRRGIELADSDASRTVTDSGGVYLWGAQLEQRSSVTAYTPTTTQPITNYIPVLQSAASGEARFDHDPITGESKGLLIEEQRTNLLLRSEEFDNAAWNNLDSTITANTIVSPDGTLTGDKIVENTDTAIHGVFDGVSVTSGQVYTISIYAKAAERDYLNIAGGQAFSSITVSYFDLINGTIVNDDGTQQITSVGNGWHRCSVKVTASSTVSSNVIFSTSLDGANLSYTGDGYSGIYIWGAQVEEGAFPTSYIPTVASQVTRNADAASMTGTNFSSWYRADEGTLYVDFTTTSPSNLSRVYHIDDGSANNRFRLFSLSDTVVQFNATVNGSNTAILENTVTSLVNTPVKTSFAYAVNNFGASSNASSTAIDTSGNIPTGITRVLLGNGGPLAPTGALNGTIKKIAYYTARLSNTELQGLTS